MSKKATAHTKTIPTKREVEETIIELVAEAQDRDVHEVRDDLVAAGAEMPLDSLEGVEIIVGLEERFDVRLPDSPETCAALKSVETLVEWVRKVARKSA